MMTKKWFKERSTNARKEVLMLDEENHDRVMMLIFLHALDRALDSYEEDDYVTVVYIGETCQKFSDRMKGNFPSRYVKDHFPITHQIKLSQELEGRVIRGNAHKSAGK
jgi:hypothetical protein